MSKESYDEAYRQGLGESRGILPYSGLRIPMPPGAAVPPTDSVRQGYEAGYAGNRNKSS
jgi:hypothetical protein